VKKLVSIGVALALLTMAVVPGAVAAYTEPDTFAKTPFAIIQSGIELVGDILEIIATPLSLPAWLNSDLTDPIAEWAGGPLSWTVDMMGWGLGLVGMVLAALPADLGLPAWLGDLINAIACGLFTPFGDVDAPAFDPS
jgi:hypothetical protein